MQMQAARVEAARATDGDTGGRGPSRGIAAIAQLRVCRAAGS